MNIDGLKLEKIFDKIEKEIISFHDLNYVILNQDSSFERLQVKPGSLKL